MSDEIRFIEQPFQVIRLKEGDVLVITHPTRMRPEHLERLSEAAKRFFGGREILVLEEGMQIGAIAEESITP